MKKYILFLSIVFIFMCSTVFALDIQTKEIFKYEGSQIAETIVTNDGNYLSFGRFPVEAGYQNATSPGMIKYNKNGDIIWKVVLSDYDIFSSVVDVFEDDNGTFYLVGYAFDPSDGFIAAVDKNGNVLWNKTTDIDTNFGTNGVLYDIELHNGKLYAVGAEGGKGVFNIFNLNGELEKHIKYDRSELSNISSIKFLNDDYILLGSCYPHSDSTNNSDVCIGRFDSNNENVWYKTIDKDNTDSIISDPILKDNEIELFVVHGGYYTNNTSYSLVELGVENDWCHMSYLTQLSGYRLADIKRTTKGFIFSHYITNSSTDETMGYISALDERGYVIEDSSIGLNSVSFSFISSINGAFDNFFVTGFSRDSSYRYFSNIYELRINADVIKNPTYHGDYTVEIIDGKGIITVQPDQGFELYKIVVKDTNGDNVALTEENGKYYFNLSTDVNVSVMFSKVDSNSGYNIMKKIWSNQGIFVNSNDMDLGVLLRDVENIGNGNIVSSYINLDESGRLSFVLSLVNSEGIEQKKISSRNNYFLDVVYFNDYIYVYSILDVEMDTERYAIVKYDLNLNVVKEIKLEKYYSDIIQYKLFSVVYNIDFFKVYNNNLYLPYNDGVLAYDDNLNLINDYPMSNDLCSIYEHYCYFNISESEDVSILGFDSNDSYVVYSGSQIKDDKYKSFIILEDLNGNTLFEKNLDRYEGIISVVLYKDYIIGIGSFEEDMSNTEMFIMDYQGNILQTMNDAFAYYSLRITDNGIVTYSLNYSNAINGSCSNDDVCVSSFISLYSLFADVKLIGKYSNYIDMPSNVAVGENVDVNVKGKFGYTFEGLKITDSKGNVTIVRGTNFIMPDDSVRIEPIFNPIINPNTGSFISFIAMILFGGISVFIYKYVKKHEPITTI